MVKILFVCLGNICRSPMAEMIFRDLVQKSGAEDQFEIASAATSNWELGNPPHPGTQAQLRKHGISWGNKRAVRLTKSDYDKYDLILGMDRDNIRDMQWIFNGDPDNKIHLLKEYIGGGEVDDPYYTGNFDQTYQEIYAACQALLEQVGK